MAPIEPGPDGAILRAVAKPPLGLSLRSRLAVGLGRAASGASRMLGAGDGAVVGGKVALWVAPEALRELSVGKKLALVSGTNGKTTTTRLLFEALSTLGPAMSNAGGANLPSGILTALWRAGEISVGAIEVDEAWLPFMAKELGATCAVLLNLSRDQLDRVGEVRMVAERWRRWLETARLVVVANADDPLVAWSARDAASVIWVGVGLSWRGDAQSCPACGGTIEFGEAGWYCRASCGMARPDLDYHLEGSLLVGGGEAVELSLLLPGRFNLANAAMAAVAAKQMGVDPARAAAAMRGVVSVDGRYETVLVGSGAGKIGVKLLLAKNPAGWSELLGLVADRSSPLVAAINARVADGRDTSWLWDVEFERLSGRFVVATGERWRDLGVRLRYAEVEHVGTPDFLEAVTIAASRLEAESTGELAFLANYTAFFQARRLWRAGR
jgi:UDP-N-acetylmuramyl tripeptide synthase